MCAWFLFVCLCYISLRESCQCGAEFAGNSSSLARQIQRELEVLSKNVGDANSSAKTSQSDISDEAESEIDHYHDAATQQKAWEQDWRVVATHWVSGADTVLELAERTLIQRSMNEEATRWTKTMVSAAKDRAARSILNGTEPEVGMELNRAVFAWRDARDAWESAAIAIDIAARSGWNPGAARSVANAAASTAEAATVSGLERLADGWSHVQDKWDGTVEIMETRSGSDDNVEYGDHQWHVDGEEYNIDSEEPHDLEYT
eukprot:gnl/MRDRNA2_/MRDRNA2_72461_c0_seq4.p1 gnl/MRDRNA2_/MRDRNA2_72461_c0~~gnl/MRDRNA2_/MRDRNA2_72461_c0_seq4.p1  ORF type:complete len:260 (-),score=60.92 gnl/MRDRNA2_/MRDRNA2_72461_c0_seq4:263-1042(-)